MSVRTQPSHKPCKMKTPHHEVIANVLTPHCKKPASQTMGHHNSRTNSCDEEACFILSVVRKRMCEKSNRPRAALTKLVWSLGYWTARREPQCAMLRGGVRGGSGDSGVNPIGFHHPGLIRQHAQTPQQRLGGGTIAYTGVHMSQTVCQRQAPKMRRSLVLSFS